MAWDVMSGVTKMAWDVMSGVAKTAWDVLSRVANLCGMFCPGCKKMAWDVLSRDVLSGSLIIIITTQHKSHATCPNSEFVFRFYICYTELSKIANGDLLDWYFIGVYGHQY